MREREGRSEVSTGGEVVETVRRPLRMVVIRSEHVAWFGLRTILQDMRGVLTVGEAWDGQRGVALARRLRPDVVAMADRLQGSPTVQLVDELRQANPESKIVVVAEAIDGQRASLFWRAGVDGYLSWSAVTPSTLRVCLLAVSEEDLRVCSRTEGLETSGDRAQARAELTPQEKEVLDGLMAGRTEGEIAQSHAMSARSVQLAVASLKRKMGARTLFELGLRAGERHLLP